MLGQTDRHTVMEQLPLGQQPPGSIRSHCPEYTRPAWRANSPSAERT